MLLNGNIYKLNKSNIVIGLKPIESRGMKYRKKPVVIEAMQWTDNTKEILDFCGNQCLYLVDDTSWQIQKGIPHESLTIYTLEGSMNASRNDYIIKGINGEFYPCKPDIFEKTYEKVERIYEQN